MVVKMFLDYLKDQKKTSQAPDEAIKALQGDFKKFCDRFSIVERKVSDLHEWHNHHDDDGVFKWHIRKSFEGAMRVHTEASQAMAVVLAKLATAVDRLHRERDSDE